MARDAHSSTAGPDTAESHFTTFSRPLIDEAIAHAGALQAKPEAEVLHKLRVALRRLRSLLWAYRPLLNKELDDRQRNLLKELADAAGQTRDWDILIALLCDVMEVDEIPLDELKAARGASAQKSREALSQAGISSKLEDTLNSSIVTLDATRSNTSLRKFARRRVQRAERSLHERMRRATRGSGSDYRAYHEVRKAGKKVRYLLDFFEPLLTKQQLKKVKELKKIQKRFGALNDVVASEELLKTDLEIFGNGNTAAHATKALRKERKRRIRAAAKLLR